MVSLALKRLDAVPLFVPAILLLGLLGVVAGQLDQLPHSVAAAPFPETVRIEPRPYSYRASGDFQQDGVPINGPLVSLAAPAPLDIMRFEVREDEYRRCVEAGACEATSARGIRDDFPVTGVSFEDATAYARWLSSATGQTWRLPTIEEWAFAAGSKAVDHALKVETDGSNQADRWLATYDQETAAVVEGPSAPGPFGNFGVNEFGVADLSANVWEWTETCLTRTTLPTNPHDDATSIVSCGVRYLEGRHRSPMNVFVRDARGGGCSAGVPPENLGFRLVRQAPWYAGVVGWFSWP
ncbi:SUMF1/EgtB/PvdO family nonheme iron enzyme [Devosia sp.]|uniref:SUMF1/EgtB/PvdO family nonheme iron enzyme n=1 Tax=Devosia sp. TaxID=1871048 RepID=UPI00326367BD